MSSITLKTTEVEGALTIARLDVEERNTLGLTGLTDLFKRTDRGDSFKQSLKNLDAHMLIVAKDRSMVDNLEAMCKFSIDGTITLDHVAFAAIKPCIRT